MNQKLPFANKDLGQHFLKDDKVIHAICDDFKNVTDVIFEVGPGPAVLTKHLSAHKKPLYVFEKDNRFPEILQEYVIAQNIYLGDATKINWLEFINANSLQDKVIWLVSNLPYNVSVPLFTNFLSCEKIEYLTLMFQKEVAEKILNFSKTPKDHEMGSLMALSQTYFEVKLLCKVLPGAFVPPPKVDSAVLSFKRLRNPEIPLLEKDRFEKFLRILFQQKRKQMGKVLKAGFPDEVVVQVLQNLNLDRTRRAETLTLSEVQNMYREFSKGSK